MPTCLIALGSNLGDRRETLDWACQRLEKEPNVRVVRQSRWHETAPVGGPADQPGFLNGAVVIETTLDPEALLERFEAIETERGRRRSLRWGPRVLDLDLLLYDQRVVDAPWAAVPHPRMAWRRFVLEPAAEVAAEMVHPTTGWTVGRLLEHLDTAAPYVAIAGPIGVGKTRLAELLARKTSAHSICEEFDLDRLDAFYANPSGNAWAVEIEFLNQRSRLLAADAPPWSEPDRLQVSDFWFDQSLAYARVWLPADRQEAFEQRWHEARPGVVPPKLTVLLDAPSEVLLERIRSRGRRSERRLDGEHLERIRAAILELAGQPGHGPILRLVHDDTDQVLEEVVAAIDAMKA